MTILIEQAASGVLTLTMQRPEKKNALNLAMYRQLTAALQQARQQSQTKVVVIQGDADCFTSGNDLQDFLSAGALDMQHPVVQFLYEAASFPKPLIAAVAGLAIGIGTTLLLHCDLVYAAPASRLQMPFTLLGLCPEAASSLLLPQIAGYQRAAQYLLLGEAFSSEQAAQFGLVNDIVPAEQLLAFVAAKAATLAALPSEAVLRSKALLKAPQQALVQQVIGQELLDFQQLLSSDACQQQLAAFFKRR
ncbi:MAG: enoyl-CoA hydratase-related protein [Alishewanella sp.]|uniref:enoyl-CoA hydratase-related protein n=1 Tax=Alishewanella sp. HL-SH05 TaxID=3461145 RepID=UPI002762FC06|nr:enoyl-CoA hydratase-related protein [Alishewanella sp.]